MEHSNVWDYCGTGGGIAKRDRVETSLRDMRRRNGRVDVFRVGVGEEQSPFETGKGSRRGREGSKETYGLKRNQFMTVYYWAAELNTVYFRKGQRTIQRNRILVGSDQQM